MELQVCLLEGNQEHVPKDEIVLLQAGLGRRTVNISENADHEDISRALQEEYPKIRGLCGGWLLKKGAGGSGKRKITSLPQGTQGYTGKILKTSSNSGKCQSTPAWHVGVRFPFRSFHTISNYAIKMSPTLLMTMTKTPPKTQQPPKDVNDDVIAMQSCPICGQDFAVDYLPTHAAWCDERY
ncbi:unnamed protein product [Boreogadus saida]